MIDEGKWGIMGIKPADATGDTVLEPDEIYTVYVNLTPGEELGPGDEFSLELTSTSAMFLRSDASRERATSYSFL